TGSLQRVPLADPVIFQVARKVEQLRVLELHLLEQFEGRPDIRAATEGTTTTIDDDLFILEQLGKLLLKLFQVCIFASGPDGNGPLDLLHGADVEDDRPGSF